MALNRQQEALLKRAVRVLDGRDIGASVRAIVGPGTIPASEGDARTALEKMAAGIEPSGEEAAALATVIRILRPVLLTSNATLPALPSDEERNLHSEADRAQWETFRALALPSVPSVGRIETKNGEHVGTGFLVGERLLATNRHVLEQLTAGSCVLSSINPPHVVFGREYGNEPAPDDFADLVSVKKLHDTLDVALLEVSSRNRTPVPLSEDETLQEGMPVAVIGYPAKDQENPYFLERVMGGLYGYRCVAQGEVLDGMTPGAVYHDCSTSQGNSGSPVFSVQTGRVIAIHRSGRFMYRNEAVPHGEWRDLLAAAKR